MYNIAIITLGGAQIVFQYKQADTGRENLAAIVDIFRAGEPEMIKVADDYGREAYFRLDEIAGYFGSDAAEACKGNADARIIEAHAQADLQVRANADPKLRFAGGMAHAQGGGLVRQ